MSELKPELTSPTWQTYVTTIHCDYSERTGEPFSPGNSEETRNKGKGLLPGRFNLAMV